jgi:prepilin-type N-terminal cleavage/methylation domain-containing protein
MRLNRTAIDRDGVHRGLLNDEGLTLPELLITVVILGIIMVPLGNAMLGFMKFTDQTTQRLNESHDLQLAAAYFAQDAQSVGVRDWSAYPYPLRESVEYNAAPTGGSYPCGTAATPVAAVRMAWDDPAAIGTGRVVVSYVVSPTATGKELHRLTCGAAGTVTEDIVVAHNVVDATADAGGPGQPGVIVLHLRIKDPKSTGDAVSIDLSGQRRQT